MLTKIVLFVLGTTALIVISRKSLLRARSHGFYRFFAWEILLAMFLLNAQGWFRDPLAWYQLVSWTLLIVSLMLVILGVRQLRKIGKQDKGRSDPSLLGMEKTSQLVTTGVYRYIRHPLYSSLLFLGWGMFFKSPSWLDAGLALLCALFLTATARSEERENIEFFGAEYEVYMQHSKMFIPQWRRSKEESMVFRHWMYRDGRPNWLARALNRGWAIVHSLGISPNYLVTLEVVGRRSGKTISFPLVMTVMAGERYLVSMLGEEANWVKNVRAAGSRAMLRHGITEQVRLQEVDVSQRAPILKAYLQIAPGARPHLPVTKGAPISEFENVAAHYPVFRVETVD